MMVKTSIIPKIGHIKATWMIVFVLGASMLLAYGTIAPAFALSKKIVNCNDSSQNEYYGIVDEWGKKMCYSSFNPSLYSGVQLNGTSDADHLVGTDSGDVLYGWGGNDIIEGSLGADIINSGAGDDWVFHWVDGHNGEADSSMDAISCDTGNDWVWYNTSSDSDYQDTCEHFNVGNPGNPP